MQPIRLDKLTLHVLQTEIAGHNQSDQQPFESCQSSNHCTRWRGNEMGDYDWGFVVGAVDCCRWCVAHSCLDIIFWATAAKSTPWCDATMAIGMRWKLYKPQREFQVFIMFFGMKWYIRPTLSISISIIDILSAPEASFDQNNMYLDEFATENTLIVANTRRWPLLIDPHDQVSNCD